MTFDFTKHHDKLFFVPLGGSNEIGMNLNLYHYKGKWLMIDCGIGFCDDYLPGIDVMVPDIDFIVERKDDLLGIVLTHAHEDHLGAIPYLWRELEVPVYATAFTGALLKHKFKDMGPGPKPDLRIIEQSPKFSLGPFDLEGIGITHSIPEMQALAITTDEGVIMHTGDWKLDDAPQVGEVTDYEGLKRYGDKGILAAICDSTNVFVEGSSGSEEKVRKHLTELIKAQKNRVCVTTFASNVARLDTIIKAAHASGRVVALAGRSMWRMVETAHEAGYLTDETEFMNDKEAMQLPRQDVLILCTGCQGEPRAALTRIANDSHPALKLQAGDSVIMSSRKIPGNETKINYTINKLVGKGVEVITDKDFFIHVSGHPARDELKKMYELLRPQVAIPVHGETAHIHEHSKFAKSLGIKETIEPKNGSVVLLSKDDTHICGSVESGYLAVDGPSLIATTSPIIKDRRRMRDEGAAFVSFSVGSDGRFSGDIQAEFPGLLDAQEDADLIEEYIGELEYSLKNAKKNADSKTLENLVFQQVKRFIKKDLDKRPLVVAKAIAAE